MFILIVAVVVAVIVVAIGVPVGIWLGRKGRGSMELRVPNQAFGPDQYIEGLVHLEAKKDLGPGRVHAALVCTEEWTEWNTDADGDRTRRNRSREIYRHPVDVASQFAMRAGDHQTLQFTLPTPSNRERNEPSSGFGRFLQSAAEAFGRNSTYKWEVETRYDMPGLDLKDSRQISMHIDL